MNRFYYDGHVYQLDFENARTQDQDILLPDGRVLIVGAWKPVRAVSYAPEIAYYQPTQFRQRHTEKKDSDLYAQAQPVTFTAQDQLFQARTYLEATDSEVEHLIEESFGLQNYSIAEGWEHDSYHSYAIDQSYLKDYQDYSREQVTTYLQGGRFLPDVRWMLCECILQGILQEGTYMIYYL